MSTKDRLKAYLWEKRISQAKFAESIGASITYVNNIRKGLGAYEGKIREVYPDLNITWVITGDGEMINASAQTTIAERGDMVMIQIGRASCRERV